MEGLELSVLRKSEVLADNPVTRLDSSYFLRDDKCLVDEIRATDWDRLSEFCDVTDGIHTSIDFEEGTGIRVISAKHPKEGFFDLSASEEISAVAHQLNPRTALRISDVIISTVGTIGNVAVVTPDLVPANSDRHVGIIRPRANANKPISSEYLSCFLLSRFGRMQSRRETTGNVQPNLFLDKIRRFMVARLGTETESAITAAYRAAKTKKDEAETKMAEAESLLLAALGLAGWSLPEPLSYTARAADALTAARLDAQYFMPSKLQMIEALKTMPNQPLGARFKSVREMFDPAKADPDLLVRNFDLPNALEPILDDDNELTSCGDIGSLKKGMRNGDVAMSRLRAYLKETAVVRTGPSHPAVGSSEFIVLRAVDPKANRIAPETLMVFLRSAPVQTILKWCQDGSQHPRFSERDLLVIPVPDAVADASAEIETKVQSAFAARARSRTLLASAKRAVEIAIEDCEAAAVAFLSKA